MTTAGMNIAALARRTGIAPDTLRKWEQRYAILQPVRTPGGQRRYCEEDVSRVEWLRARLDEGYRIGEAAALLGAADAEPCATPAELRSALRDALAQTDPEAVARLLDQTFALHRVESALSEVVRPLLQEVGDGWAAGRYRIAEEHLLSAAVRARLERLLAEARGTTRGVAVLACAPGERHELGLLVLAVLLREDGWQVAYLGADTPVAAAVRLAERASARVLCLALAVDERHAELEAGLADTRIPESLEVVVGGPGSSRARARKLGIACIGDDLAGAVESIRRLAA